MARKIVWGVAFYGPITRKWWIVRSKLCRPSNTKKAAKLGRGLVEMVLGLRCTIIPSTTQPDGSIAWPPEWPVP